MPLSPNLSSKVNENEKNVCRFADRFNISLCVTNRAEVELVRPLRELGYPGRVKFIERFYQRHHIKAL